jgi:hypothetical protein
MHLPRLIGLVGVRRSGKDTAAQILDNIGYRNIKFAEPLKAMLRTYLEYAGVNANHIERIIDGDLKEASREVFGHRSARYAMQTLGTEWGRNLMASDLWVDLCMRRCSMFNKAVVTDVRFPNEVEAIRKAGGKIVRITRPNTEVDNHTSESLTLTLPVDLEIANDGTISDLHMKVLQAVIDLN